MQVTESIRQVVALIALLENQFDKWNKWHDCAGFGWGGAMFWIDTENSVDNTGMF